MPMATKEPITPYSGFIVGGRFIPSSIPVTTADMSEMVWGRFIIRLRIYSKNTHEAIQTARFINAMYPKIITPAMQAGVSAIITRSIILRVLTLS